MSGTTSVGSFAQGPERARMIPSQPSGETKSESERLVFRRLRDDCPADWIILHSVGIAHHARKRWAEADFLVINSQGVLIVEVKGGQISREEGVWYSGEHRLPESPFQQAGGSAAALRKFLRGAGHARRAAVDGAVLFPDVVFDAVGPEIDLDRIGDVRALEGSLDLWVRQVQAQCREANEALAGRDLPGLSAREREEIVDLLAGDFDLRPNFADKISRVRNDLVRFTDEQLEALEIAADNDRTLFEGGAGTGKTMLALEECLRSSRVGKQVLLVCFNKPLAFELATRTKEIQGLTVLHFHGLVYDIFRQAGLSAPPRNGATDSDYFQHVLPLAAFEVLFEMENPPLYDVLIVDESQDLLYESALDLFDAILRGGLSEGRWSFFHDSKQDIYEVESDLAYERMLSFSPARKTLRHNCRNTAQIASMTSVCSGREPDTALVLDGPEVQTIPFIEFDDLRRSVGKVLREWILDGIDPESIVILSKHVLERSALRDGMPSGVPAQLTEVSTDDSHLATPGAVRFSTIHAFKGLEADAILLLSVGDLQRDSTLLYVGLSRARYLLAIGIPSGQQQNFDSRLLQFKASAPTV